MTPLASLYHPLWFYLITMAIALAICPLEAYLSTQRGVEQLQSALLLLSLCVPCITALMMIYGSSQEVLKEDFWRRLLLFKVKPTYLLIILLLMPCMIYLATGLSLFFGYSTDQFSINKEIGVMKGWSILGITLPLILAPLIEELGWRGYGVDSLRASFNLFTTSLLFGLLWGVWHLPLFFIKGYYHNQLLNLGSLYVINFFASVLVMAFLMNWVYYRCDRSIPALILFHAILNLSSMLFKTEPFTKCLVTVLLAITALIVIISDSKFFFNYSTT